MCQWLLEQEVWIRNRRTHVVTKETRLRVLQWKILHNIYPTNILLYKMKVRDDRMCSYCNDAVDCIEHFFFDCNDAVDCIEHFFFDCNDAVDCIEHFFFDCNDAVDCIEHFFFDCNDAVDCIEHFFFDCNDAVDCIEHFFFFFFRL